MKTSYEIIKKDFKDFTRMSPEIRRDRILQGSVGERLNENERKEFNNSQLVECLISYKKGAAEQIISYLTQRTVKAEDIKSAGLNQILLRGEQTQMQHIAGALDVNAPDLITNPANVYIPNSGNYGKIKLSPKGVTFNEILDKTAYLVNEVFNGKICKTPENFVQILESKKMDAKPSEHSYETAILDVIRGNFHEAIETSPQHQKLGVFMLENEASEKKY